ncbi:hypothetical protein BJX68DRAFT_239448 [Aspergillus pseudodeflectus]|uniref:Uncharacterized protein n=1 Tax=Aspergillus pseudodeflectus TaxID=176178 RepID=A0ABR4K6K2_9EURO
MRIFRPDLRRSQGCPASHIDSQPATISEVKLPFVVVICLGLVVDKGDHPSCEQTRDIVVHVLNAKSCRTFRILCQSNNTSVGRFPLFESFALNNPYQ